MSRAVRLFRFWLGRHLMHIGPTGNAARACPSGDNLRSRRMGSVTPQRKDGR